MKKTKFEGLSLNKKTISSLNEAAQHRIVAGDGGSYNGCDQTVGHYTCVGSGCGSPYNTTCAYSCSCGTGG